MHVDSATDIHRPADRHTDMHADKCKDLEEKRGERSQIEADREAKERREKLEKR